MLWLLLLAPVALLLDAIEGVPAPAVFFCAAIAIVPIAKLIVESTESEALGPTPSTPKRRLNRSRSA